MANRRVVGGGRQRRSRESMQGCVGHAENPTFILGQVGSTWEAFSRDITKRTLHYSRSPWLTRATPSPSERGRWFHASLGCFRAECVP